MASQQFFWGHSTGIYIAGRWAKNSLTARFRAKRRKDWRRAKRALRHEKRWK